MSDNLALNSKGAYFDGTGHNKAPGTSYAKKRSMLNQIQIKREVKTRAKSRDKISSLLPKLELPPGATNENPYNDLLSSFSNMHFKNPVTDMTATSQNFSMKLNDQSNQPNGS